jgi:hypothetical protein
MHPRILAATAGALLCLSTACTDRAATPIEPPPPVPPEQHHLSVSGRAFLADGSAPSGVRVILYGDVRVSSPLAADGTFTLQGNVTGDSVDVIIDVVEGGTRTTLPALVRVSTRAPAHLRVMLVPTTWTVSAGSYQGTSIDVSMDQAFRPPCTNATDINCDGFYPRAWFTGTKLWPASALPVPVAFDHQNTHRAITAADSTEFWRILAAMNEAAGTPLFRAARAVEINTAASGIPNGGVAVRVDTTLTGFAAWANWWWNASGEMYAGVVRLRTTQHLRSGNLVSHELLHTQGFKHSCSWPTVMDGYTCHFQRPGLTAADVAYAQLARHIHEAQRAAAAPHGLIAALQGERVVLRGLPRYAPAEAAWLLRARTDGAPDGDHAH